MRTERIATKDKAGRPNGWVLPLWNVDSGQPCEQVYVTAIAPAAMKGPHLHMKRAGRFCCIKGDVRIVTREGDQYIDHVSGETSGHEIVQVPAGTPAALYNIGEGEALVVNMPSPQWRADDQDQWPVGEWAP